MQYGKNQNYTIEAIDDSYINKYLDARNIQSNLKNMTETKKITSLNHYIWWLKNERSSFVLKKGDDLMLYIWHQLRVVDDVTVLVGGWFSCVEHCAAVDVIYALNWQLEHTGKYYPSIPWVAIIKKTNRFVKLLNKRFGFELINKDNELFDITSECFPNVTTREFDYFCRK